MDENAELIEDFVVECREHLDNIEEELLTLERTCNNPELELVNKVFRAIHSVKGAAGFLGLIKINDLSHIMETLLNLIRSGEIKPESQYVDALLQGVDLLTSMLDDVHNSNDVDIVQVHDQLAGLMDQGVSSEVKEEMEHNVAVPGVGPEGPTADLGFDIDEFTLRSLPSGYAFLYVLKYDLQQLSVDTKHTPLSLVKELLETGEIVDAKLQPASLNISEPLGNAPLQYLVLYSSVFDEMLIGEAVGLPEESIMLVDKDKILKGEGMGDQAKPETAIVEKPTSPPPVSTETKEESGALPPVPKSEVAETVRIPVNLLDELMTMAGELVLVRNQHQSIVEKQYPELLSLSQHLDLVTSNLQETIMRTRMQPIGNAFGKLPRMVRDLSKKLKKKIELQTIGDEVEMDKTILQSLADPLVHLIRNCCDHGLEIPQERADAGKGETGTITVKAYHEGGLINIDVIDDGKGIDVNRVKAKALERSLKSEEELERMSEPEIVKLIMLPGFSTAEKVSDVSGRGVGMDVVRSSIEQLGGSLDLRSVAGQGSTVQLRMPLTLAIIPCLVVGVGERSYAIPQINLEELVCLDDDATSTIESAGDQEVFRLRENLLPIVRIEEVLKRNQPFSSEVRSEITKSHQEQKQSEQGEEKTIFAVVKAGNERYGLVVDQVIGTEEIVVKPMHPELQGLDIYSGMTVMGDGRVSMIFDIDGIAKYANVIFRQKHGEEDDADEQALATGNGEKQTILLFKSGPQEQFAMSLPLIKRIEKITADQIENVGDQQYVNIDDTSIMVLRLDQVLNVTPCDNQEDFSLILPKHTPRAFGIVISKVVNVMESDLELRTDGYMEDGILGSAMIDGHQTIFPDIFRLVEKSDPKWFSELRKEQPAGQDPLKILLAEDTPFFRQLIKGYLESDGHQVVSTENGREALVKLQEEAFDLIVSDIEMPLMSGWELMEQVRANKQLKDIPAVAISALDSPSDIERSLASGFQSHSIKIDRERLLKLVNETMVNERQVSK